VRAFPALSPLALPRQSGCRAREDSHSARYCAPASWPRAHCPCGRTAIPRSSPSAPLSRSVGGFRRRLLSGSAPATALPHHNRGASDLTAVTLASRCGRPTTATNRPVDALVASGSSRRSGSRPRARDLDPAWRACRRLALLLRDDTSHDVDVLAAAQRDRYPTASATRAPDARVAALRDRRQR
jgi:hypothetical protein